MVSGVTAGHVVTRAAYLLFYRRRQPKILGPPSLQKIVEDEQDTDSNDEDGPGKEREIGRAHV